MREITLSDLQHSEFGVFRQCQARLNSLPGDIRCTTARERQCTIAREVAWLICVLRAKKTEASLKTKFPVSKNRSKRANISLQIGFDHSMQFSYHKTRCIKHSQCSAIRGNFK